MLCILTIRLGLACSLSSDHSRIPTHSSIFSSAKSRSNQRAILAPGRKVHTSDPYFAQNLARLAA